ncbi:MAG: hypothetical protein V3U73_12285 [bacterium]
MNRHPPDDGIRWVNIAASGGRRQARTIVVIKAYVSRGLTLRAAPLRVMLAPPTDAQR